MVGSYPESSIIILRASQVRGSGGTAPAGPQTVEGSEKARKETQLGVFMSMNNCSTKGAETKATPLQLSLLTASSLLGRVCGGGRGRECRKKRVRGSRGEGVGDGGAERDPPPRDPTPPIKSRFRQVDRGMRPRRPVHRLRQSSESNGPKTGNFQGTQRNAPSCPSCRL